MEIREGETHFNSRSPLQASSGLATIETNDTSAIRLRFAQIHPGNLRGIKPIPHKRVCRCEFRLVLVRET